MARHSKNNTAGSVFTYGERQRLKSQNEWGEISARIGRDSQKKFEQCCLCLKTVEDPMTCPKGHLFCKACIIENLLMQKKEIKNNIKMWKEDQNRKEQEVKNKIQADHFKKMDALRKNEDGVEELDTDTIVENRTDDQAEKYQIIEDIKERKSLVPTREKKEMIKECFWLPEKTPTADYRYSDKPSEKLICPVNEKDHFIKLKEFIKLNINKSDDDDKFSCCVCNKELSFQKIVGLKTCGHVMCKKCLDSVCIQDGQCSSCNEAFYPSDVMTLIESGTGFSTHNQVQTNKINHSFKF